MRDARLVLVEAGLPAAAAALFVALVACVFGGPEALDPLAARWPRETAPLLVALVSCSPLAAARAGELARWQLDHRLDALRAMGASVFRHLVAPRLLAGALALPLLVLVVDGIGLAVALLLGRSMHATAGAAAPVVMPDALAGGLARAALFGIVLAGSGCVAGLLSARRSRAERAAASAATRGGAAAAALLVVLHVALGGSLPW
ncbi:MAG TPA: ABC transporter permease [Myxococcota bacterium]